METLLCVLQSLMGDSRVEAIEKSIYLMVLMESPRSMRQLAALVNVEYKRVRQHCIRLASAEWLRLERGAGCVRPCCALPRSVEERLAHIIREYIAVAPYKGEAIAKALVHWVLSPTVRIMFNVRLPQLKSGATNQPLEYDIYIPDWQWAGEYYGRQHFGPTALFPSLEEFVKRSQRDREKAGLSKKHGTHLSIIAEDDLSLEKIDAMIRGSADQNRQGLVIDCPWVCGVCRTNAKKAPMGYLLARTVVFAMPAPKYTNHTDRRPVTLGSSLAVSQGLTRLP